MEFRADPCLTHQINLHALGGGRDELEVANEIVLGYLPVAVDVDEGKRHCNNLTDRRGCTKGCEAS